MERAPFGCLPDELPWYMTTLMLKCVTTRSLLPRDWSFIPTALQFHPYGTAVSPAKECRGPGVSNGTLADRTRALGAHALRRRLGRI